MTKRKPVFIEKIFPIKLLNEQVYYENGGNPFKGLHRWYSRKPLSFSRASVLGSILPADVSIEEFEYLLGLEKREYRNKETKLYKTPPSPERIKQVHALCEGMWGTSTPTVLDAFAGGGSIPFEAARYGLNVLASDLNPVAVVTMKAAIEFPLKFGPDLQQDIDKWVKWVGDEAEKRLAEFFPSEPNETVQNYLWAHTVVCPSCESVVPLSPNWWLSKTTNYAGKGQARKITSDWYAVRPIPNLEQRRVDFELVKGKKGKGDSILLESGEEYDPSTTITISRGVGKCPNCGSIIGNEYICSPSKASQLGHQMYAVAHKNRSGKLEFSVPRSIDLSGIKAQEKKASELVSSWEEGNSIGHEATPFNPQYSMIRNYGITEWLQCFNDRQFLTLVTYVKILQEVKGKLGLEHEQAKVEAISTYLALVLDRCVDVNCRLAHINTMGPKIEGASGQHSLNLIWNYPEVNGASRLWQWCADKVITDYPKLCEILNINLNFSGTLNVEQYIPKLIQISLASSDSLTHIDDKSVNVVITDPPYYGTIPYADLSDFFYVWQKHTLGDIFPDLFWSELTDKDREAVANPSRFRGMGGNPEKLANQDYEAKMALAFAEYYRVLRDDGVMTVQFNHKDSGAWDVLAKSLIDAGFEITASWAVSTENPQNLHQAQKNSVSSTVLLVCRKRDPDAGSAWWEDLRPEVANLVEQRAPEFEANDIDGIDLYLSAFGPALNVFSRHYPILNSSGEEVRPEEAFTEARKAVANYRFRKLAHIDTAGFDPLTIWYLLAWDAFRAREFPFDDARQLALAIGGFNISELKGAMKLLEVKSGTCRLLTPAQRAQKRAFSTNPDNFVLTSLVDALHATIAIYQEEQTIEPVRRFLRSTELINNDLFMRAWEVTLKVIPLIRDSKKRIPEEQALADLWLAMDEIKAKVVYVQQELDLNPAQQSLSLPLS
jgi:putative DNA methylase